MTTTDLAVAYDATAAAWSAGATVVYDRLAEIAVGHAWNQVEHPRRVLDIGAGTGGVGAAAARRGAGVVAIDAAAGMLAVDRERRPPACVADAVALPFSDATFDLAVAGFCLNHLVLPAVGLREAIRVVRPGGAVVVTSYAHDDFHPVKAVVDAEVLAFGWQAPSWYATLRTKATPQLATVDAAKLVMAEAGARGLAEIVDVAFADLTAEQLVAWRLGLVHLAPFLTTLDPADRARLAERAVAALGRRFPPLVRSMVLMTVAVSG